MKTLTYEELESICKEWMKGQPKLELFRDYDDYLEDDTVKQFLNFVDSRAKNWEMEERDSYLYDFLAYHDWRDWFNSYEHDSFYDQFVKTFIDEHEDKYEFDEDWLDEILRELMYDLDKYDANLKHFDRKDYRFYIITNPDKTLTVCDDFIPPKVYECSFYKSLIKSQGWTRNSTHMKELRDWAWWILWIAVKINCSLSYMVELIKAKRLTIKAGSDIFLFNAYNGSWGCDTELTSDWTINNDRDNIWYGVDGWNRCWPYWYTPDEVYWWYHPAFDKNKITFKFVKNNY